MVCVALSACSTVKTVESTLDCIDLWRFENCIVFDAFDDNKAKKKYNAKKSHNYKIYKPQRIIKPSKTWGD